MIVFLFFAAVAANSITLSGCSSPHEMTRMPENYRSIFHSLHRITCVIHSTGELEGNFFDVGINGGSLRNDLDYVVSAVGSDAEIDVYYFPCDHGLKFRFDFTLEHGNTVSAEFPRDPRCGVLPADNVSQPQSLAQGTASAFFVFVIAVLICFCVAYFYVNPRM